MLTGFRGIGKGKWSVLVLREPNCTTYLQLIGGKIKGVRDAVSEGAAVPFWK